MLVTNFDGEEIIHRLLWGIAKEQAEEEKARSEGWFNPGVVARVFAYHTVEAYLNYVGERIAPEVWKDERSFFRNKPYRGALGKLQKVVDLVGLPWTPHERPLKTVLDLKEIRDLIAHGKAEKLHDEVVHPMDTEVPYPVSRLRNIVKPKDKLSAVLSDVESFLNEIQKRAKPMLQVNDVWFGDEALQGPSWYSDHSTTLSQ